MQYQYRDFNQHYEKLLKIGQGSYGKVYLCSKKLQQSYYTSNQITNQNSHPNVNYDKIGQKNKNYSKQIQYFALKKLKRFSKGPYSYEQSDKKKVQKLREIQIMRLFVEIKPQQSINLIKFEQILQQNKQYQTNHYLVLPFGVQILQFAKHKQILITKSLMKCIIKQIINGIEQINKKNIIHRDIKPDNIFLMKNSSIKIGDFSLSRTINQTESIVNNIVESQSNNYYSNDNINTNKSKLTGNVTTRFYRAPQIMYGSRNYDNKIDIWSLGCTLAELILHQPIFPGQTDINQLQLIFQTIGYPQQKWLKAAQLPYYLQFVKQKPEKGLQNILPDIQPQLLDLISKCLQLDPQKRATIQQLSKHKYLEKIDQKTQKQLEKIAIYLHKKKIAEYLHKNN